MKKILFSITLFIMIPTIVLALDFAPTLLRLSAPSTMQYDFDGANLEIPVTVSGVPARTFLMVYTKGQAENVDMVQNGFLGWHFVNNIDTCVYLSQSYDFEQGKQTITWDGKDDDGSIVPAGEYTYYLWAYDFATTKIKATPVADANDYRTFNIERNHVTVHEYNEAGEALVNPLLFDFPRGSSVLYKWALGADPEDPSLLETTDVGMPAEWMYRTPVQCAFDPTDNNVYYMSFTNTDTRAHIVSKYTWVPNGEAVKDENWGTDLQWTHNIESNTGLKTDGEYLYMASCNIRLAEPCAYFYIIDFDGTEVENFLLEWWIRPDEYTKDVGAAPYLNGGPQWIDMRDDKVFLGFWFCMFQMVHPKAYLESGDMDDFTLYSNANGDYINDRQWMEDAETPWVCFGEGAPHAAAFYADANYFGVVPQYDMGAVSFSVMGPDGTGVDHFAFAGETAEWKAGQCFVQSGSAYDGMYSDNRSLSTDETGTIWGLWFTGHDSIKGTISNAPVAVEEAPIAFAVDQNTPNPFNPTTTINFSMAEAGNVTVDVFNVSGQKIDTLVNDYMGTGTHSVVWDASEFSAGVYFYTVKSGSFSKTMKMTLLK